MDALAFSEERLGPVVSRHMSLSQASNSCGAIFGTFSRRGLRRAGDGGTRKLELRWPAFDAVILQIFESAAVCAAPKTAAQPVTGPLLLFETAAFDFDFFNKFFVFFLEIRLLLREAIRLDLRLSDIAFETVKDINHILDFFFLFLGFCGCC